MKPRRLNARPAEAHTWNGNLHLFIKREMKKAESFFKVKRGWSFCLNGHQAGFPFCSIFRQSRIPSLQK
jgi:hypothetical protein